MKALKLATGLNVILLLTASYSPASAEALKVVSSFTVISDFAKNVGGDKISLTTLVGPDGDAHVYEPKPSDAVAVAGADVVLVNGLHFEGFLPRLVEASATKAPIVELTKGVEPIKSAERQITAIAARPRKSMAHTIRTPFSQSAMPRSMSRISLMPSARRTQPTATRTRTMQRLTQRSSMPRRRK